MQSGSPLHSSTSHGARSASRGPRILFTTLAILLAITGTGLLLGAPTEDGPHFGDVLYTIGLAGIVGFGTNWIAIRMLFHPYEKIMGVQGVIPRKRALLSRRAAELMEDRLVSGHRLIDYLKRSGAIDKIAAALSTKLRQGFDDPGFNERALDIAAEALCSASTSIVKRIKAHIEEKLKETAGPFASLASGMIGKLADSVAIKLADFDYVRTILVESRVDVGAAAKQLISPTKGAEGMIETAIETLLVNLHIADLIEEELAKQSIQEFEQMVDDAANSELVFLQVAGGVLGALAGFAMLWPWLLAVYGGALVLAFLLPKFKTKPKLRTYEPSGRHETAS